MVALEDGVDGFVDQALEIVTNRLVGELGEGDDAGHLPLVQLSNEALFEKAIFQIIGVKIYPECSAVEFLLEGVMGVAAACRRVLG